ncbi:hypothetical protein [Photobacterium leiognathi]|uniref:hypothetical protein n=1 Tax=Photobacterium leiognathi TaxID=553611 RepID=UPI00298119E4|nr:hypothetical protein [Photobacterium leiognathi]
MNWTLSAVSYFYFSFVGVCYMLGYWTPLHFNILDFLSPVDVIKSAAYPVIPALIGSFIWIVIDTVNSQPKQKLEQEDPKLLKVLFCIMFACILIVMLINLYKVIIYIYLTVISEPERRLAFALPVISIASTIFLLNKPPFLQEHSRFVRHFVIIFMCVLPTIAFQQGDKDISQILVGKKSHYVLAKTSKNCIVEEDQSQIYLGFYSTTWFFVNRLTKDLCLERDGGVNLSFKKAQSEELVSSKKEL